ncbi:MAG: iron ABC transporter permease [Rhodobacteraceae bacterium]|nr:iron ABC transporter permease [Paracoccaceae bacterium]
MAGERAWTVGAFGTSCVVLVPIIAVAIIASSSSTEQWAHLTSSVLPGSLKTTLILMFGVAVLTIVIGVGTAWLTTMCQFPGRGVLDWALLLPLAIPTYIMAFSYIEVLDYSGPLQSTLRAAMGYQSAKDYWFPDIRTLPGAIYVMGFVLYPYVYLTTRASFLLQPNSILDVSRTLGASPYRFFASVALPLARPAIAVGAALALMECLNDIGAVTFFGVRTLTFSVYDMWLNRSNLGGAAQLSMAMLAMVFLLIWLERFARRKQRYDNRTTKQSKQQVFLLTGWRAGLAFLCCGLPVLLGFIVPALLLADRASRRLDSVMEPSFQNAIFNSLSLAIIAAVLTVIVAVTLVFSLRLKETPLLKLSVRIASIGYALPGTVLAVGILIPLASLDNFIDFQMERFFGISTGLLLLGSGAGLLYAYLVRFLAVAYGQVEGGFGKIPKSLDMASRTLGDASGGMLKRIHLPILKPVLLSALLLTFVDCMKELPATILLRPFNFDTLATTVFEAASREAFEDAALPALAIVIVGLLPVIYLARTSGVSLRANLSNKLTEPTVNRPT